MRYEPIPELNDPTLNRIGSQTGNLAELRLVALALAIHAEDPEAAESACLTLSDHPDGITRGNAILALGHLARIHRRLSVGVRPVVEAALRDPDDWVRGQADAAADDIEHFLGWKLDRPAPSGF